MQDRPLISICIPVYKRIDFLKRLLDSIVIQQFKDYEVVVADDSPSNEVEAFLASYSTKFKYAYYKNTVALGTPENWNAAVRMAKGQWIKLMHDDDWFVDSNALSVFAEYATKNQGSFIFSNYINVYDESGRKEAVVPEAWRYNAFIKNPSILVAKNLVGPPSVVMHPNDGQHWYDKEMKWLVDIDMYIRRLNSGNVVHIEQTLVYVGISSLQVTALVKNDAKVEVPEHFRFLEKEKLQSLNNILVYDYWWRFIRKFAVKSPQFFADNGFDGAVPQVLKNIIGFQNGISRSILKIGVLSKALMFVSYISNKMFVR